MGTRPSTLDVITAIGLSAWVAGVLDVAVTAIPFVAARTSPLPVLAAGRGLLGDPPATADVGAALLGIGAHFLLMLAAAAVFVLVARAFSAVANRAVSVGLLYGAALFFVLPHAGEPAMGVGKIALGVLRHVVCIGLPFGLITVQLLRPAAAEATAGTAA